MRARGWSRSLPLLSVPALVVGPAPPSPISAAFSTMAQRLDPDAPTTDPYDVVWLRSDGLPEDPADEGRSPSGIYLPKKCQSIEEWTNSPLIQGFLAKLRKPGEGAS